jgi:hypothetical protein
MHIEAKCERLVAAKNCVSSPYAESSYHRSAQVQTAWWRNPYPSYIKRSHQSLPPVDDL